MNYHKIGEVFSLNYTNGDKDYLVARECETTTIGDQTLRKTCKGCFFAYERRGWCSGHRTFDVECRLGQNFACEKAKCTPEYREDGKFIHFKRVIYRK